jgi:DNA-binding MarR family transcriptional regulator
MTCNADFDERKHPMKYIDRNHIPTDRRPLGFWLRAIDGQLRETMRGAFATFGVTRREWRVLTTLHNGPASVADLELALPPRREHGMREHEHAHRTARPHRTLEQLLDEFVQRGWASADRGSFALTAEGERIHDAVLANVQKVRAQVTAGIPDADYATTMSTLEKIAGNVGWQPGQRPMRRRGPRGHLTKA